MHVKKQRAERSVHTMKAPLRRPVALVSLVSLLVCAPAVAAADDGDESAMLDASEWVPVQRARSSRSSRSSSGSRFHASLGGGVAAGHLWMDYTVDSRYQEDKDGLVQDEEIRQYYFLAKPMADLELGVATAGGRLVLGFHIGVSGMSQRVGAAMVAEWDNGTDTVIDRIGERRYSPALLLIGVGGHYVFLPDRKFTPLLGLRVGVGVTWDADFHMIDAWKSWYKKEEADIDKGLYYRYRVPIRGGLDVGVRFNINDNLGIALHVPVEAFATHGYLRGVILGANARIVVQL
jgi:hypothetical protein